MVIRSFEIARKVLKDPSRSLEELKEVWKIAEQEFERLDPPIVKGVNVFFIGFNKTGTTSIHETLKRAGFKSEHNPSWTWRTYSPLKIGDLASNQIYSDGECPYIPGLTRVFPESFLIYQSRDWQPWLLSRCAHVESNKRRNGRTDWIDNSPQAIRNWIERRLWFEDVISLIPNVTRIRLSDSNWIDKIGELVGVPLEEVKANIRNRRSSTKKYEVVWLRCR